jgi:hypothetical protein
VPALTEAFKQFSYTEYVPGCYLIALGAQGNVDTLLQTIQRVAGGARFEYFLLPVQAIMSGQVSQGLRTRVTQELRAAA